MLTEKMTSRLNEQIGYEFESANLYLQMSSWCAGNGLDGCAAFLRNHSDEEMGHMMRLFDYVNETGAMAVIPSIPQPRHEFETVREIFEATLEHEKFITGKITDLVDTAFREKDYSTFNFLQWYVAEQHEEEALFKRVLDMIELTGTEGSGMFHLDREIGNLRTGGTAADGGGGEKA